MLTNTFLHLPRLGATSEQNLWKAGVRTWADFLQRGDVPGIGSSRKPAYDRKLKEAQRALLDGDSSHFCCLPSTAHWRTWEDFSEEACFIDIETNYQNNITVLGIYGAGQVWQFVRHHNMDARAVRTVLSNFKLIVTFNGACFDLPIIKRVLGGVVPEVPHLDLRFAAAKVGLTGGLKSIERKIGIARDADVEGVSGADALKLWHAYRSSGNEQFRDTLLQYNEEDIVNLEPLAQLVYDRLVEKTQKLLNA